MFKKISLLALTATLTLTLVACSGEEQTPAGIPSYGTIDKDAIAFKNGSETTITNKELYDRLKFKYGYELAKEIINTEILFKKTDKELQDIYTEHKKDVNKEIIKDIYGTDDLNIAKLYAANTTNKNPDRVQEGEQKVKEFIYKQKEKGFIGTENDFKFDILVDQSNNELYVEFKNITIENSKLLKHYLIKTLEEDTIKKKIIDNGDAVEIYSYKDDKKVVNPAQTDRLTLERYFIDSYRTFYDANGIILKYNSRQEAIAAKERALNKLPGKPKEITEANKEVVFLNMFNEYFINEEEMTNIATDHRAHIIYDEKDKETKLKDIEVKFKKDLKDGEFTQDPFVYSDKNQVYMIYRKELKYFLGAENDTMEAEKLPADIKPGNAKYDEMLDFYAKEKAKDDKIKFFYETNIMGENSLKIHDVFLEEAYKKDNPDSYKKIANADRKDLVIEGKNFEVTPADFFDRLKNLDVTEVVYEMFLEKKLLNEETALLNEKETKEAKDKAKDEVDSEKSKIKNNRTEYDKAIGVENYLFIKYGSYEEEEIKTQLYVKEIKKKFLEDNFWQTWATKDHELSDTALKLFKLFKQAGELNYQNVHSFKLDLQHLLLYVDTNADREADDMDVFISGLTKVEKKNFEEAVIEEYKKIIKVYEYKYEHEKKLTIDALKDIANAFNARSEVKLGLETVKFESHGYKIYLKAENLAEKAFIDNKSVNDYVVPFKNFVRDIAQFLETDTNKIPELQVDDVSKKETHNKLAKLISPTGVVESSTATIENLCNTQFGYHLLALQNYVPWYENRINENDLFKDDNIKLYEITIKEEVKEDDKVVQEEVYLNDYFFNDNGVKPEMTARQAFLYYASKKKSVSINYKLQKVLDSRLEDVVKHFTSETFQMYCAYFAYIGEIETVDTNIKTFNKERLAEINSAKDMEFKANSPYANWYDLTNFAEIFKRK